MVINWNKNGYNMDLFQIKEKKEKRKEGRKGGRGVNLCWLCSCTMHGFSLLRTSPGQGEPVQVSQEWL